MTEVEKLDVLIHHASDLADRLFVQFGEVAVLWVGEQLEGPMLVAETPWTCTAEKMEMIQGIKEVFADLGVVRYAMLSEAWMVKVGPKDNTSVPLPSRHPDRVEVVTITAGDKAGNCRSATRRILRPEGRKPYLDALDSIADNVYGNFVHILGEPTRQ